MQYRKITLVVLFFVLFLAFFLRFYKVSEIPPSLNWDEVAIGYNAFSILKTGKDEWGKTFPLHFKSYGEYKLPAQIYFSIPAIAIFGLNDFGVRITPIIYGTLTVFLLFFLARSLFGSSSIGLLSAFFLAISPWHIQLTRASFESSFAVFWITLGFWFLIKGLNSSKYLILSTLPLSISIYTYNSARVFIPIFLLVVLIIYKKKFLQLKKATFLSTVIFLVLMIPFVLFLFGGEGNSRYKLVSVTDDPGLVLRINEARGNSKLPTLLPELFYNKVTFVSYYVINNYLAHFTPEFLFISGAPHKQHHVQNMGELYLFQAPFLLIGLILLLKRREKYRWFLIAWILLAYIPVSVTNDSIPHALRTLIAAPFYQLISALGLYWSLLWLTKRNIGLSYGLGFLIIAFVIINFYSYIYNFYLIYPYKYSRDWQYGNKQIVNYIKEHQKDYDLIVYSRTYGEPHMFTLFYLDYDPAKFQNDPALLRFETYDWVRVLNFSKFYFPDLGDKGTRYEDIVKRYPNKKILFIGKPDDFSTTSKVIYSVNFLDGNKAFEVVRNW